MEGHLKWFMTDEHTKIKSLTKVSITPWLKLELATNSDGRPLESRKVQIFGLEFLTKFEIVKKYVLILENKYETFYEFVK